MPCPSFSGRWKAHSPKWQRKQPRPCPIASLRWTGSGFCLNRVVAAEGMTKAGRQRPCPPWDSTRVKRLNCPRQGKWTTTPKVAFGRGAGCYPASDRAPRKAKAARWETAFRSQGTWNVGAILFLGFHGGALIMWYVQYTEYTRREEDGGTALRQAAQLAQIPEYVLA